MKKIAVLFPGIGYHCDKPLLYFSRKAAQEAGYEEILPLSYVCDTAGIFRNPEKMRTAGEAHYLQAEEALKEVRWQEYDDILLISKSVGTGIAAAYAKRHAISCRNVFFTPVALTFEEHPCNGIAFTGSRDPWVETEIIVQGCREAGLALTVVEGGNHSLETGDTLTDLTILRNVIEEVHRYLRREESL